MRAPIEIRIRDGFTDRLVTKYVKGFRFSKSAPGGHRDASCQVLLPESAYPDLGPADRLFAYDARSARTLWEGYTNNPSSKTSPSGDGFDLSALGGMVLASDQTVPAIYVDYSFDGWERATDFPSAASASTDVSTRPSDGLAAILCQFIPGQPVTSSPVSRARMTYEAINNGGLKLGGVDLVIKGGKVDGTYTAGFDVTNSVPAVSAVTGGTATLTTTATVFNKYAPADFTADARKVSVQLYRSSGGATNVADDNTWAAFTSLRLAMQRVDKFGATVVLTTASSVLAHEVVGDLLGRVLTMCDPAASSVDVTTFAITNLAYKDGVKAAQILDDLALYEPDMLWEILESNTAGLHRFNYRAWPTTPRYVIGAREDVEMPGSDADLCNRIAINWVDAKGRPQVTVRTSTVTALGSRIRDAEPVTLPEGRGSIENAIQVGDQILATKANPPRAARVTVTRPVVDSLTGGLAQPWEIEPGYLARIQETGEDLRVTEMEYTDDSCSTDLTLGDPVLTFEQRLIRLAKAG